jgi:hypothetical protein
MKRSLASWVAKAHSALGFVWIGLLVPTLLWWKESILWIAVMSWWANVEASFANRLSDDDVERIARRVVELLDDSDKIGNR